MGKAKTRRDTTIKSTTNLMEQNTYDKRHGKSTIPKKFAKNMKKQKEPTVRIDRPKIVENKRSETNRSIDCQICKAPT